MMYSEDGEELVPIGHYTGVTVYRAFQLEEIMDTVCGRPRVIGHMVHFDLQPHELLLRNINGTHRIVRNPNV